MAANALLQLPNELNDRVALDVEKGVVYVDQQGSGNPLLTSWIMRNKMAGHSLTKEIVEHDRLAQLRSNGLSVRESANDEEVAQRFRPKALELLHLAARYRASDMHIMVREGHTEIQIEVKGALRVLERDTQENGESLTRAIYQGVAKVRDASYNQFEFQNAQIPGSELPADAGLTSIRIARGPCYPVAQGGQFMTLRLQYSGVTQATPGTLPRLEMPRRPDGELRLAKMGLSAKQIEKLRVLMDAPNGVIIVTGPTGSGKTTLLFECLQEGARAKPWRRLVTIEDPVEYPMAWGVQLQVTDANTEEKKGAAFSERLRSALRMAPKNILIGELLGPEVAAAALQAGVTGHQVWTTLHVTDVFMFADRLELMDQRRLNRKVFCDHKQVRGVIGVRLLPALCPDCSSPLHEAPHRLAPRIREALATWGDISGVRVKGDEEKVMACDTCNGDGTVGRFSVAEIVVSDKELMSDLIEHGSVAARSRYRARPDADPSMMAASIARALRGEVDPTDIEEQVDLIQDKDQA